MSNTVEQRVTQVLQSLEEAKNKRMRDEAALGALQNEHKRILAEAKDKFSCRSLDELNAELVRIERVIGQLVAEAEQVLEGGEIF